MSAERKDFDWRIWGCTFLAKDVPAAYPGAPSHKAGDPLFYSSLTRTEKGELIGFIQPRPAAMAINISISNALKANSIRDSLSDISGQEKESDRTRNGILRLEIRNESRGWVEVSRAVFDSYFMPIYFDTVAGMVGEMKIYSRLMAQTNILDRTFREGMEPALPIIRARKIMNIDLERKGFLMEHGVG